MATEHIPSPITAALVSILMMHVAAQAEVVSTFDIDRDGWSVVDVTGLGLNIPTVTGENYVPEYLPTGGTTGGAISQHDPSGYAFFFRAPQKFLGDQSQYLHGRLSWNLMSDETTDAGPFAQLLLSDGTSTLIGLDQGPGPANTWHSYAFHLYGANFYIGTPGFPIDTPEGLLATDSQLEAVLANLTLLYILGDEGYNDTDRLDDVFLVQAADLNGGEVPEASNLVAGASAVGISALVHRHRRSRRMSKREPSGT